MAKKPTKPATPAATTALNLALIGAIMAATLSPAGGMYVSDADAAPLITAAYIEQNPSMVDATGAKMTRMNTAGQAFANANKDAITAAMASGFGTPAPVVTGTAPAAAAASAEKPAFTIVSGFALPPTKRGGALRSESYPFSKLEVGQAFFIAATADKPQPERSYASTVASARDRYATEVAGQTRTTRKGNTVAVLSYTRDFKIRAIPDGAQFGHPGVVGAVVVRTA